MRLSSPVRLVARLVFIAFLILSVPATARMRAISKAG